MPRWIFIQIKQPKKCGTVVPQSNFQFVLTKGVMKQSVTDKFPRGRARTSVRPRTEPSIILNVLIACEESQAECQAFRELGHNAFSCDIQMCRKSGNPDWHICSDVLPYLQGKTVFTTQSGIRCAVNKWDLIIAHPPCTYLTKIGSPWLYKDVDMTINVNGKEIAINSGRYNKMLQARAFFMECLNAQVDYLAVENPIPMRLANLPRPSFYADPSWFGVKYTKKTLYWVKNLPQIMPEIYHPHPTCYVRSSRGKYRSRTFPQLAHAIACQWSQYIIDEMLK